MKAKIRMKSLKNYLIKGEVMDSELFDKGLKIRREVLGTEYVDASIRNADDLTMPLQELVTKYC